MQFFSTRDQNRKVTSSEAIAQGLSNEGGLFVPESFPQVDVKALKTDLVRSSAASSVHFALPVSRRIVQSVGEHGQCSRKNSTALTAVVHVQPLAVSSACICASPSASPRLPCAR